MIPGSAKSVPNRQRAAWRRLRSLRMLLLGSTISVLIVAGGWTTARVRAQTGTGTITLQADVQEANALTGVITARGNVQVEYPERDIYATSAQAQYFSAERRMILSGDVIVLQEGNRLEAETVTYLVDEGRFVALPQPNQQVRSTYILPASEDPAAAESSTPASSAPVTDITGPRFEPLVPDTTLDISPIESPELEPTETPEEF